MALVKFETNEELDLCIEGLKLAYHNVNTGSAAAKHALLNYQGCVEEINELHKEIINLKRLLHTANAALQLHSDAQFNIKRATEQLDQYFTQD